MSERTTRTTIRTKIIEKNARQPANRPDVAAITKSSRLAKLVALIPDQPLKTAQEGIALAKRQADFLRSWLPARYGQITAVPESIITEIPGLRIEDHDQALPGTSVVDDLGHWVIQLSRSASLPLRRVALGRELKYMLDYGRNHLLYPGSLVCEPWEQAQRAADYFVAALFVPEERLRLAWEGGIRHLGELASLFCVDEDTVWVGLSHAGLVNGKKRRAALVYQEANVEGRVA